MKIGLIMLSLSIISISLFAQDTLVVKEKQPGFKNLRAEENYEYLKNKQAYQKDVFDAIKFIPLNKTKAIYLSFGGQIRSRVEMFSNRKWNLGSNEVFYSQRIALHLDAILGKNVRFFGEFYHGITSNYKQFTEYDILDIHQFFLELKHNYGKNSLFRLRIGRLETPLGSGRLVGLREGPNIRRVFDAGKLTLIKKNIKIDIFYGKEVKPLFEAFDNNFTLFNRSATNPELWGAYSKFKLYGFNELYYLGFHSKSSSFANVAGSELRHSIGLRRFGKLRKQWNYNVEITYQFGRISNQSISAFNIDADFHYDLIHTKLKIKTGLKLVCTSGDVDSSDTKLNSYNPMFANPSYYSLATTITPINLISAHPYLSFNPLKKLNIYIEWAYFWRTSLQDGVYRPPRFLAEYSRSRGRSIGSQFGLMVGWKISRHLFMNLDMSYFLIGDFLSNNQNLGNTFHLAPTINFKF